MRFGDDRKREPHAVIKPAFPFVGLPVHLRGNVFLDQETVGSVQLHTFESSLESRARCFSEDGDDAADFIGGERPHGCAARYEWLSSMEQVLGLITSPLGTRFGKALLYLKEGLTSFVKRFAAVLRNQP